MPGPARIGLLDSLRGFALFGIVIINGMSIMSAPGSPPAVFTDIAPAERALQEIVLFLIESKFFTIFSLLFGIGFAIQMGSAQRAGDDFTARILRRFGALFLFGFAHVALLWDGDILMVYAVTGLLLLPFRDRRTMTILRWVAGLLIVPTVAVIAALVVTTLIRSGASLDPLAAADAEFANALTDPAAAAELARSGYFALVPSRLSEYAAVVPLLLSRVPTVLAMFLLGLLIGRSDFLRTLDRRRDLLKRTTAIGLGAGSAVMLLIVVLTRTLPPLSAIIALLLDQYLAGPLMALGYAAGIALLYSCGRGMRLWRLLAPVGRMALTNYLMQSLMLTFFAFGWGLGLAGQWSGYSVLALCVGIFAVQILYSRIWLTRFDYGPMEWLWRCITYWRLVPLRTRPAPLTDGAPA